MSKIAGTPGPMPPPKGLRDAEAVVGSGEENGMDYVDLNVPQGSITEIKAQIISLVDKHGSVRDIDFEDRHGIPCNADFLRALRELIESGEFTNNPPPEHLKRQISWIGLVERVTKPKPQPDRSGS